TPTPPFDGQTLGRGLHALFDAGALVGRFQFHRQARSAVQPKRQRRQELAHGYRLAPHVQHRHSRPLPPVQSPSTQDRPPSRRAPGAGPPNPRRRSNSRWRPAARSVTTSPIPSPPPACRYVTHLATNASRCNGRSLFAGLTNSTAPASRGPPDRLNTPTSTVTPDISKGWLAAGADGDQPVDVPPSPRSSNAATSISTPNCTFASAKYPAGKSASIREDK